MRNKRGNPVFVSRLQIESGIRQVAEHRAGGGILACAPAIIQRVANDVATDINRVVNVMDAGQDVLVWNQHGVDADLNPGSGRGAGRPGLRVVALDDAEELDRVTELTGKLHVHLSDGSDAFNVNRIRVN